MPQKPMKPCAKIGCSALTRLRHCPTHTIEQQAKDRQRANGVKNSNRTHDRLYQRQSWKDARKSYLMQHPLCVQCEADGVLKPAALVDHIKPHNGDMNLFWDVANWQGLCWSCHSRKTWKESNERRDRGG